VIEMRIKKLEFLKLHADVFWDPLTPLINDINNIKYNINVQILNESKVSTVSTIQDDGTAFNFKSPDGLTVDANGNIYVADKSVINRISIQGLVSKYAGMVGAEGYENGPAATAKFKSPLGGLVFDAKGSLYVADRGNNCIRKISNGNVSTFAGTGRKGFADGSADAAMFNFPTGLVVDGANNVYVADRGNHRIRMITPEGIVSTIGGSDCGYRDGSAAQAQFNMPRGLAIDKEGNLYVSDTGNRRIRKVYKSGVVETYAGNGDQGCDDGISKQAQFGEPYGIAVDPEGDVYVADRFYGRIRRISPSGNVVTIAGSGYLSGNEDGLSLQAKFRKPTHLALDAEGNLYISDEGNHRLRKLE